MKRIIFTLAAATALLLTGCTDTDDLVQPVQPQPGTPRTLQLTAASPGSSATNTRLTIVKDPANTKNLISKWEVGDVVDIGFLQETAFSTVQTKVTNVKVDGSAVFEAITVPAEIKATESYTLYAAVNGSLSYTNSAVIFTRDPGDLNVSLQYLAKKTPFFCKQDVPANATEKKLSFRNVGSILSVHIKNSGTASLPADMPVITLKGADASLSPVNWCSVPAEFDITSGNPAITATSTSLEMKVYGLSSLSSGATITAYGWFMPSEALTSFNLNASIGSYAATTVAKPITQALPQGKNIHLYLESNADGLTFVTGNAFDSIDNDLPKITFTTASSTISLWIEAAAADRSGVWIDLNNNGIKDPGEGQISFSTYSNYTLNAQIVTIYGKITSLDCSGNSLTSLDVSGNTALTELTCSYNSLTSLDVSGNTALTKLDCSANALTSLDVSGNIALTELGCPYNPLTSLDVSGNPALTKLWCYKNQISGTDMTALVTSLPARSPENPGKVYIYDSYANPADGNVATKDDVTIAEDKNWNVFNAYYEPYEGQ